MATGMELMFAKMLGITPDKLAKMSTSFVDTVNSIDDRLKAIEENTVYIKEKLHKLDEGNLYGKNDSN